MALTLAIGNKAYSSWSMRPWLVLRHFDIRFSEVTIPLNMPDTKKTALKYGKSGKVPALVDGKTQVWDSLAIIAYVAEKYPAKAIWPKNRLVRAYARCISAEMHSGFQALRLHLPMQFLRPVRKRELTPAAEADVARIIEIWTGTRKAHGKGGPFLFGKFTAADAMYAPVVNRLHVYDVKVPPAARAYMNAILALPAWKTWEEGAKAEPWRIASYDEI